MAKYGWYELVVFPTGRAPDRAARPAQRSVDPAVGGLGVTSTPTCGGCAATSTRSACATPATCDRRAAALLTGLSLYGLSMAMMVRAELGLDPWDVFHQGLSRYTPMTIGVASAVAGVVVLMAWIPLRNRPGVGTVFNVVVIAVTVDAALAFLPAPQTLPARVALMVGAVLLNAVATVLYVGPDWVPAQRDGLMTGLVARSGLSVRLVRTTIEATVLTAGWLLGGSGGSERCCTPSGSGRWSSWDCRMTPAPVRGPQRLGGDPGP